MKRLTTDAPQDNFQTMVNYVFSKDDWAHIRYHDGRRNVPLTDWAKEQCRKRDCYQKFHIPVESADDIDETMCSCIMEAEDCPIALAYIFACQAAHLRDRLKAIEDILGDDYDLNRLREILQAEETGRLVSFPFVAMVEQFLSNGEMTPKREQNHNGRYAVVYLDRRKWKAPLIDICGKRPYDREEAEARMVKLTSREAEGPMDDGWFRAKDALPEAGKTVIVYTHWNGMWQRLTAYYSGGQWYTHNGGDEISKPTHWRPLPQPPKEAV